MSFQDTGFQNNAFQLFFAGVLRVILSIAQLILPQTLVKLNTPILKVSLQTINIDNCIEVKLND